MTRFFRHWLLALASACIALAAPRAIAADPGAAPWSAEHPRVREDLEKGEPLVVRVVVPLCHNGQIDCGSKVAGKPGALKTNLYWGAIFGARRFLDRKNSGWTRIEERAADGDVLERVVYRRFVPGKRWGLTRRLEQIVVLEAVHGEAIDRAVERLWSTATDGARIQFQDGGRTRDVGVHVVGYTGHNRLMDGLRLPEPSGATKRAVPSFVLACYSESYFSSALRRAGSRPLVMTRALMAPEGYVLDAVLRGLGENDSERGLTRRAVHAYAKWQKLSPGVAASIFAKR